MVPEVLRAQKKSGAKICRPGVSNGDEPKQCVTDITHSRFANAHVVKKAPCVSVEIDGGTKIEISQRSAYRAVRHEHISTDAIVNGRNKQGLYSVVDGRTHGEDGKERETIFEVLIQMQFREVCAEVGEEECVPSSRACMIEVRKGRCPRIWSVSLRLSVAH